MCLAIPGRIVEIVDEENQIAKVEVGGVRRNVNIGMLDKDDAHIGAYVLIHVGFAMSRIDEKEAEIEDRRPKGLPVRRDSEGREEALGVQSLRHRLHA